MGYTKQNFVDGQVLKAEHLNNIETGITDLESTKQTKLVSGTNIKTVNGQSLLGSGDITVSGNGTVDTSGLQQKLVSGANIKTVNGQSVLGSGDITLQSENNTFKGKIVSVLGDSISAMQGYIPVDDGWNKAHAHQYTTSFGVNNMWWKIVIDRLGAKLGICDAWDGTTVKNTYTEDTVSSKVGPNCYIGSSTRLINLASNGTPDLILVFAGTNDTRNASESSIGTFDSTVDYVPMTEEELYTNTTEEVLATAFTALIRKIQYLYPTTKIACITPMYGVPFGLKPSNRVRSLNVIRDICDYFGVLFIDATKAGLNINNTYTGVYTYFKDGIHPNKDGMKLIGDYVYKQIANHLEVVVGESIVYTVTNNLEYLTTSKPHVVGVKKGETYTATLSGTTDFTGVTVYMGTTDVTSSVLADGVITISSVTGNIVIADTEIEPPTETTYSVSFEENGGSSVEDLSGLTTLPDPLPTTTRSGYIFSGWFTDSSLTTSAVAGSTLTSNVTLYAKWVLEETDSGDEDSGSSDDTSIDVNAVTWYVDNSSQASKTFNYTNHPGCAYRVETVASKLRGVPINVVKCHPSTSGLMQFARWIPGGDSATEGIIEIASCTVSDADVYASTPADDAEARVYKLDKTLTLSDGEYLLCKYMGDSTAGFWVNPSGDTTNAVYTYTTASPYYKSENWGCPFGIGYIDA